MRKLTSWISMMLLATPLLAQTKTLLNLEKTGVALKGFDPVAYFTQGKPVKGKPELKSTHDGATYYFSSEENKARFDKEPDKFEPLYGGFCAYGVSRNKLVEIDPEAFQIVDGHLLLQYSKSVQKEFNKDTQGNLAKANTNWPGLLGSKGK